VAVTAPSEAAARASGWPARLPRRHEGLRGLVLLAPTLLILGITVIVPFALMAAMNFWTQVGFDHADGWSVRNYAIIATEQLHAALLLRSLGMAMAATLLTVLPVYPMACFLAFHVRRNKLVWLIVITLAHAWAAFALLPIHVSLEKIDRSLPGASADLGEGPVTRFFRVILPLSMPGVIAGTFLMFIPTVGDYVTAALVGGPDARMIGNLIQLQFGTISN